VPERRRGSPAPGTSPAGGGRRCGATPGRAPGGPARSDVGRRGAAGAAGVPERAVGETGREPEAHRPGEVTVRRGRRPHDDRGRRRPWLGRPVTRARTDGQTCRAERPGVTTEGRRAEHGEGRARRMRSAARGTRRTGRNGPGGPERRLQVSEGLREKFLQIRPGRENPRRHGGSWPAGPSERPRSSPNVEGHDAWPQARMYIHRAAGQRGAAPSQGPTRSRHGRGGCATLVSPH
jgi:hypothetical protein